MQYLAQRVAAGGIICEPFGQTVSTLWGSSLAY